jgi:uncharacterized protein (DUF488 family)
MPHFSKEYLAEVLPRHHIDYLHEARLGGWRRSRPESRNTGWRNKSFQGYADYMETPDFQNALDVVIENATTRPSAIMCAEALWWHCHRMLISDALTVRGWPVLHIGADGRLQDHRPTPFAVIDGERLTYPAQQGSLLEH